MCSIQFTFLKNKTKKNPRPWTESVSCLVPTDIWPLFADLLGPVW